MARRFRAGMSISTRSAVIGRSLAFTRVYQPQGPPAPQCPVAAFGLRTTCHTDARGFARPKVLVKLILALLRSCQHLGEPSPISIDTEISNDDAAYSVQRLPAAGIIRRRRSQSRDYSAWKLLAMVVARLVNVYCHETCSSVVVVFLVAA